MRGRIVRRPADVIAFGLFTLGLVATEAAAQNEWPPRPIWRSVGRPTQDARPAPRPGPTSARTPAKPARVAQATESVAGTPDATDTVPEPAPEPSPPTPPPSDASDAAAPAKTPSDLPTADQIRERIDALPADLDPDTRDRAVAAYDRAVKYVESLADYEQRRATAQRLADTAEESTAEVLAGLVALANLPDPELGDDVAKLEALEAAVTAEKTKAANDLNALEIGRAERDSRVKRLAEAAARADKERTQLNATVTRLADSSDPADAAEVLAAKCKLRALDAATYTQQVETAQIAAEQAAGLYAARQKLAEETAAHAARLLKAIGERLASARQAAAREQLARANREANGRGIDPGLKPIADGNREIAGLDAALVTLLNAVTEYHTRADGELEVIDKEFAAMQERVKSIGLTQSLGLMLRRRRAALPGRTDRLRRDFESARAANTGRLGDAVATLELEDEFRVWRLPTASAEARAFEYRFEDEADELPGVDRLLAEAAATAFPDGPPPDWPSDDVREEAERLRTSRVQLLKEANGHATDLADELLDLAKSEADVARSAATYREFIESRIVWVRSTGVLEPTALWRENDALTPLLKTDTWRQAGQTWLTGAARRPWLPAVAGFGALLLYGIRRRTKPQIAALGRDARRRGYRQFTPTVRAAVYTVLGAAPGPALLVAIAVVIPANDATFLGFADNLRSALLAGAAFWYPLELLRLTAAKDGLAEGHLGWPTELTKTIRLSLNAMRAFVIPLVMLWVLASTVDSYSGGTAWERVAFIAACLTFATTVHPFLSPRSASVRRTVWKLDGWIARDASRLLWVLAVGAPCLFAGLSVLGYHYTATRLAVPVFGSLFLFEAVVIVASVLLRAVRVFRRRLRVRQLVFARRQRRLEASRDDDHAGIEIPPDEPIDAERTSEQARRLILVAATAVGVLGLWGLWADLVPVLRLDEDTKSAYTAYEVTREFGSETASTSEDGESSTATTVRLKVPVTYFDLIGAAFAALLTGYAARNLPGLIEIAVLAPLPIDAATRYAITRIVSYAVLFVGTISTAALLGITWGNVAFLAAALTVGLGFGLQEVFANFVSGLIILFERPIRVGDIVTLDDTTGVVSRVRIRATTITNWDKQEFIVPNKDFITGRLLNWTLTDTLNRIVVKVGIAYGSDVTLARETIARVCAENQYLLKDPAPLITLEGFGASSLDFVVRAYLPKLDDRLTTIHELHRDIDLAFRDAGIEISFPQLDLHVRDIAAPVETRVTQN